MSTRTPFGYGVIRCCLLALALTLLVPAGARSAAAQTTQLQPGATPPTAGGLPPMSSPAPARYATPAATAPVPAQAALPGSPDAGTAPQTASLPTGMGLCQCVSDRDKLDFSCPGSAQACQSSCGQQYSFKPDALCRAANATK